ncbi:FimV/HubP family polar landmark protein [Porticoccaceae bacterium LTM1]|nr:FimV/HubP family polar landmark protein [Porticoccaceae bacterium LTM1]
MALRKKAQIGAALSLLFSQAALSVGLGDITLNSALNEPLDAEIELLNVGDLSDVEMLVALASNEDFARTGVAREFFLTDLKFTVDLTDSRPMIRVKSQKPVREPYLDFLVELQWPSGRLLREYTLLVDLPVFAEEQSKPKVVNAPAASSTVSSTRTPVAQPSKPVIAGDGEYTVESGDTLWRIASRAKTDNVSVQQSMLAIHKLNPQAFINGDIDRLKRGAVLRLPQGHQMGEVSAREAILEVASLSGSEQSSDGALIDAVEEVTSQSSVEAEPAGRLKLSAAQPEVTGNSSATALDLEGVEGGSNAAEEERLENELAIAEEELALRDRELAEERDRVAKLEERIATMQRMIEVKDSTMSDVQQMAAQSAEPSSDVEPAAEEVTSESVAKVTSAPTEKQVGTSFFEEFKYYLIAGGALLVTLLLFLVGRRKKPAYEDNSIDFDQPVEPVIIEPELPEEDYEEEVVALDDIDLSEDDDLFVDPDKQGEQEDFEQAEQPLTAEFESEAAESADEMLLNEDQQWLTTESEVQDETEEEHESKLDFDLNLDLNEIDVSDLEDEKDPAAESDLSAEELDEVSFDLDSGAGSVSDDDFDLLDEGDEISTKLDLAQAYLDMGDADGAREILEEVIEDGSQEQQERAKGMLESLS